MVTLLQTISSGANAAYKDIRNVSGPLLNPSARTALITAFIPKTTATTMINGKPVLVQSNVALPPGESTVATAAVDVASLVASNISEQSVATAVDALTSQSIDAASITSRIGSVLSGAGKFIRPGLTAASKVGIPAVILGVGADLGLTYTAKGVANIGQALNYATGLGGNNQPPSITTGLGFGPLFSNPGTSPGITTNGIPSGSSSSGGILGKLSGLDIAIVLGIGLFVAYEVTKK